MLGSHPTTLQVAAKKKMQQKLLISKILISKILYLFRGGFEPAVILKTCRRLAGRAFYHYASVLFNKGNFLSFMFILNLAINFAINVFSHGI